MYNQLNMLVYKKEQRQYSNMALIQEHVCDRAKKGARTKFNIFVLINR